MLGTLLIAAVLAMPQQDTTKTRVSSDTTHMPPDSSLTVDTTGWISNDSAAVLDSVWSHTPGGSFINEIWDYLITGLGPVPPDTTPPPVQPPDTTPPGPYPPGAPLGPVVASNPICLDNADSTTFRCSLRFQPDVMVDSTYWRGGGGSGTHWFPGDSLQTGYVDYLCSSSGAVRMDSRSYRNEIRSDPIVQEPANHVCGFIPPPPIDPVPPTVTGQVLTFNTRADLTASVSCAGAPAITSASCPLGKDSLPNERECASPMSDYPAGSVGCYRKHTWGEVSGPDGSGALVMHWRTGMPIGFSPVFVEPGQCSDHFFLQYDVFQSDTMASEGSAQKHNRLRCGGVLVGTLMSKPNTHAGALVSGQIRWHFDNQGNTATRDVNLNGQPAAHPTGAWHTYQIEVDYRGSQLLVNFWIDDVFYSTSKWNDIGLAPMTGKFEVSPLAEMYSCGQNSNQPGGCQTTVNTGDLIIDNFSYTILP